MLSQPVFEFTPITAPHELVVNIAWVELHLIFAPVPFFMWNLFKVKFLRWASTRTKKSVSVSVYQSASHLLSCMHAEHGEQYAFQPLRHKGSLTTMCLRLVARLVFGCYTGVHAPVAESASNECFGFALWHKEFGDFSLFVLALSSSFHDFTA